MAQIRSRFHAKALMPITASGKIAIAYFKHRFHTGAVFSVPAALFDLIRPRAAAQVPEPITFATFLDCMKPTSTDKDAKLNMHELSFFEVVDAFPEHQYIVHNHRVECSFRGIRSCFVVNFEVAHKQSNVGRNVSPLVALRSRFGTTFAHCSVGVINTDTGIVHLGHGCVFCHGLISRLLPLPLLERLATYTLKVWKVGASVRATFS